MWELSSPTRDGTRAPALAMQSLNHWFAREVPLGVFFFFLILSRIKHSVEDSINLMHVITLPAPH